MPTQTRATSGSPSSARLRISGARRPKDIIRDNGTSPLGGRRIPDAAAQVRQWFATNDNGRFEPEIVHLVESPRLGHALIKLRYRATAPTGAVQDIVSWLSLTFALEDGGWRLVFDQSTLIEPTRPR